MPGGLFVCETRRNSSVQASLSLSHSRNGTKPGGMRWHGFGKANYKGLKQKARLESHRLRIKAESRPRSSGEVVGRDRGPRSWTEEGERAEFARGTGAGVLKWRCRRLGATGARPLAHGDRRSACRFAAVWTRPSAPAAISWTASPPRRSSSHPFLN